MTWVGHELEPRAAPTVIIFVTFGRNREWRLSATLGRDRKSQLVGIGRQMLRRHMRVAAHHRLRPPSAQFLKHPGGHVILPKPARPGVAKIVPTKVGDPCPPSSQDRQDRAGRRASAQFSTAIIPYPVAATGLCFDVLPGWKARLESLRNGAREKE